MNSDLTKVREAAAIVKNDYRNEAAHQYHVILADYVLATVPAYADSPVTRDYLLNSWKGKYYDQSLVIQVGTMFFDSYTNRFEETKCWRVDVGGEYRHDFRRQEQIHNRGQFCQLMAALRIKP